MSARRAHSVSSQVLDPAAARHYLVQAALRASPVGRIGIELEAHAVDQSDPTAALCWDRVQAALAGLPPLPGASRVTCEPGGQVELSGPPLLGPVAAVQALRTDLQVVRGHLASCGLALALLGADPLRPPRRVNPAGRYEAMQAHWEATGQRGAGLAMMCSTASLQVNVDAGPPSGWARRVQLVHALGPVLVAVSACSRWVGGRDTGWRSARQRIWGDLDVLRCAPLRGGPHPADEWASYALDAPVMLVDRSPGAERGGVDGGVGPGDPGGGMGPGHPGGGMGSGYSARGGDQGHPAGGPDPVRERVPLRHWVIGAVRLGGRTPSVADLDRHLSTLFPPARLRGHIEVRYLDATPEPWWPALVAVLATLVDHPDAARAAARAAHPVSRAWTVAARDGLGDPDLARAARECVQIAHDHAPAPLTGEVEQLLDLVSGGRSPGDLVDERIRRRGPAAALLAPGSSGGEPRSPQPDSPTWSRASVHEQAFTSKRSRASGRERADMSERT
ncbi:MAG: ergothioneine biosynthesis glutamate--cysteine ligase EgtA [Angustibacter sp.]